MTVAAVLGRMIDTADALAAPRVSPVANVATTVAAGCVDVAAAAVYVACAPWMRRHGGA